MFTISISFATGRPYEFSLVPNVMAVLQPLGYELRGDYVYHKPPAEPFTISRYEEGDFLDVPTNSAKALKSLPELLYIAKQAPITKVGLTWKTSAGVVSGALWVRIFPDNSTGIDLTMPEAGEGGRIPMAVWKTAADSMYDRMRPLYGAIMYENEVPGPSEIYPGSEITLAATWIYLCPKLAVVARQAGLDGLRPFHNEEQLPDSGIFVATNPVPSQPSLSSDKEIEMYMLINKVLMHLSENR